MKKIQKFRTSRVTSLNLQSQIFHVHEQSAVTHPLAVQLFLSTTIQVFKHIKQQVTLETVETDRSHLSSVRAQNYQQKMKNGRWTASVTTQYQQYLKLLKENWNGERILKLGKKKVFRSRRRRRCPQTRGDVTETSKILQCQKRNKKWRHVITDLSQLSGSTWQGWNAFAERSRSRETVRGKNFHLLARWMVDEKIWPTEIGAMRTPVIFSSFGPTISFKTWKRIPSTHF